MALTLPFLSVSCQPQVESAKIVTIDKVGAIAMPEEIAPIGKIPFQASETVFCPNGLQLVNLFPNYGESYFHFLWGF